MSNLSQAFAVGGARFGRLCRDRRAVTSTEYAMIAVIMIIAMIGGLSLIGGHLSVTFNQVSSEL